MKLILILTVLFSAQASFASRCTPEIYRDDAETFCAQELQERITQMERDIKGLNHYLIMAFGDDDTRARSLRDCIKIKKEIYKEVLQSGEFGKAPVPASDR